MEITKDIFIEGNLIEGSKIGLRYRGRFTVEFSNEVYVVYGYGLGWKNIREQKMTWIGDCFFAEIELEYAETLNFCFKNNFGSWDNNNGNDYSFVVRPRIIEAIKKIEQNDNIIKDIEPVKIIEDKKVEVPVTPKVDVVVEKKEKIEEVENVSDIFETVDFKKEIKEEVKLEPKVEVISEPKIELSKDKVVEKKVEKIEPKRELKKEKEVLKKFSKKDKKNKKNRNQKKYEARLKQDYKNVSDIYVPNYEDEESLYEYIYSSKDSDKEIDYKTIVDSNELKAERVIKTREKKEIKEKTPKIKEEKKPKKKVEAKRSIEKKKAVKSENVKKEKTNRKYVENESSYDTTSIKNGRVVKKAVKKSKKDKDKKEKKTHKKGRFLRGLIRLILFFVLVGCIVCSVINYIKSKNVKNEAEKLLEVDTTILEPEEKQENEMLNKVKALNMQYPDLKGWLEIKDTDINYPVMQGTDNDFYITHDYKKEKSKWGSLFLDKSFDWSKPSSNLLIYGHNFSDGYMFADLLNYRNKEFYESHKTIRFVTPAEDAEYEIISVFNSRVYYTHETDVFRYYFFVDAGSKAEYNDYVKNAKKASIYDIEASAEFGDQLLTLSTCDYTQEDGRFVVVARKIVD